MESLSLSVQYKHSSVYTMGLILNAGLLVMIFLVEIVRFHEHDDAYYRIQPGIRRGYQNNVFLYLSI